MDKTQVEKFEKWYQTADASSDIKQNQRIGWAGCLEANGIGEEPPILDGYDSLTGEALEQNVKFYVWLGKDPGTPLNSEEKMMRKAWHSCAQINHVVKRYDGSEEGEEPRIPDDRFAIGEKVEFRPKARGEYSKAMVVLENEDGSSYGVSDLIEVRRISAWKPKDGEAVLVRLRAVEDWIAGAGVFSEGTVSHGSRTIQAGFVIKPFDASKIGNPWSEL